MKKQNPFHLIWLCLFAGICLPALSAQDKPAAAEEDYVKAHYTKYEYRIPMRDGVHLFTSVYLPKDSSQSYPFLIDRTPYNVGPYGEDQYKKNLGPSDEFEKAAYIFVYQDVRGRYMSEGTFVEMRPHIDDKKSPRDVDDSSDMYDTLEFLLKHVPNNNGKAGIWGISYPGFYTSASIIDSHPALKAASPQAPMTNLFMGMTLTTAAPSCSTPTSASTPSSSPPMNPRCRSTKCPSTRVRPTRMSSICRLALRRISTRNI
jgi:putative CocE/NonD family hydrolase